MLPTFSFPCTSSSCQASSLGNLGWSTLVSALEFRCPWERGMMCVCGNSQVLCIPGGSDSCKELKGEWGVEPPPAA